MKTPAERAFAALVLCAATLTGCVLWPTFGPLDEDASADRPDGAGRDVAAVDVPALHDARSDDGAIDAAATADVAPTDAADDGGPCDRGACDVAPSCAANTPCGDRMICDATGACRANVITASVSCDNPSASADQLCQAAGFSAAMTAHGYHWWQCAGTGECPGGWTDDGTRCAWCAHADCVGHPFCGGGQSVMELRGDGTTGFTVDTGLCGSYNPGWTVRLICRF